MMVFKILKLNGMYGICDSINSELVCWNDFYIDRCAVREYISQNSFPSDLKYKKSDFLFDLTTDAPALIPSDKRTTAEYICKIFSELS